MMEQNSDSETGHLLPKNIDPESHVTPSTNQEEGIGSSDAVEQNTENENWALTSLLLQHISR